MVSGKDHGRQLNRRAGMLVAASTFVGALLLSVVADAAPDIRHSPPTFEAGEDLIIKAKITAAGGVIEPSLYFRKGTKEYTRVALVPKSHGAYEARIPGSLLTGADSLEYYIGAFAAKDLSEGFWRSKAAPYRLSLKVAEQHMLRITTEPPNAILDVDNVTVGTSPYSAPMKPGSHHVAARLPGYKTLENFEFTMPKDRDLSLPFSLSRDTEAPVAEPAPKPAPVEPTPEPKPAPKPVVEAPPAPKPPPAPVEPPSPVAPPPEGMARVRIVTTPPGAKITVDGKDSGTSPVELVLSPGAYIFSAKLDGYRSIDSVVKLGPGDAALRVITLRPAPAKAAEK